MSRLECRGLSKYYGKTKGLDQVDLKLEAGRIVGLLGPNGSGKTTLIKIANGLLEPTRGELLIDGEHPGVETKARVAYLPDRDFLPSYMKISGAMNMYEDFFADFDRSRAERMLEALGLDPGTVIKRLSKGNREKVELIMTMSRRADIYLLDEPIAGVDPATRDYILNTIISNYSKDALLVISTHLIADVEPVLDEVVFLKEGRIVLHRMADELREESGMSVDKVFREEFRC